MTIWDWADKHVDYAFLIVIVTVWAIERIFVAVFARKDSDDASS